MNFYFKVHSRHVLTATRTVGVGRRVDIVKKIKATCTLIVKNHVDSVKLMKMVSN